jgi:DNA-binding MarR family transcriptional regulator
METLNLKNEVMMSLWMNSAALTRNMDGALNSVHGIGYTEYIVLHNLYNAHEQSMRRIDLANATCRTASGITRMLKPMEKIGLVEKADNPRDARVSLIKISDAGSRVYQEATLSLNNAAERSLKHISDKNAGTLIAIFDNI